MNDVLKATLIQLRDSATRVRVTYKSKYGTQFDACGYISVVFEDSFSMKYRDTDYATRHIWGGDVVLEIQALKGKRRKSGMYYEVFYKELPYVPTADGSLDMSATLRQLLAR